MFALLNIFLIRGIAKKLGINSIPSTIGALTFAFATPAFPYGVDFFQHHISTFLILLSIYGLLSFTDFWALIVVWFCFGASIAVDYPNFIMMLPICIYSLTRILSIRKNSGILKFNLKILNILPFVAVILPLLFFLWFNQMSYGNPFRLSGALQRVKSFDAAGKPTYFNINTNQVIPDEEHLGSQFGIVGSFNPRVMLNGFFVHFFSEDRGMLVYTPVMFFGLIGFVFALKRKMRFATLLAYVAGINILIYSMWGDPWGGWSFGSRYLIPAYAILSIFIGYFLYIFRAKNWILFIFIVVVQCGSRSLHC